MVYKLIHKAKLSCDIFDFSSSYMGLHTLLVLAHKQVGDKQINYDSNVVLIFGVKLEIHKSKNKYSIISIEVKIN